MRAAQIFGLAALTGFVTATTGYRGYGVIGYGITMYKPPCAHACRSCVSGYMLNCSEMESHEGMDMKMKRMGGMDMAFTTSPDCYATDDMFLQSLAFCMHTRCADVPVSKLEGYWEKFVVGRQPGQPSPKQSYATSLAKVQSPPTIIVESDSLLNMTTLTDDDSYLAEFNGDFYFAEMETKQDTYALVLLITGGVIPIVLSLTRFLPFPKVLVSKFNAIVLEPPMIGHRHRTPLFNLALVPTRGQGLFILYLIALNIILCSVGYYAATPDSWFTSQSEAIAMYIANRTGVLSLANLPLLLLYSSRNNVLLWLTNWSHATFLLVHRWIAVLCTIEACLHSAIYLQYYNALGQHSSVASLQYWIWGIVATLCLTLIIPASVLPIRQKLYELFLALHFLLAFFALIGCYFHIYYRFENQWGYETWVYVAFAIWAFDWLMRSLRVLYNGVRTARVTVVDEDYLRIDVPGVAAHGHAYVYFPTLSWRVFENHPFSVISAVHGRSGSQKSGNAALSIPNRSDDNVVGDEKHGVRQQVTGSPSLFNETVVKPEVQNGLTFFVRSLSGLSKVLRQKQTIPILLETSYGRSLVHDHEITTPNVIIIAGGVGISAVAQHIRRSSQRVRLFWGVRNRALVEAVSDVLGSEVLAPHIIGEIAIGKRLDLPSILAREVIGETTVVICGPQGMADELRALVCDIGAKGKSPVRLIDESFSW